MLTFLIAVALAGGRAAPVPRPQPGPTPIVEECAAPLLKDSLVTIGKNASPEFQPGGGDREWIEKAYCYLNTVYANGCLQRKVLGHGYLTLESAINPQLNTSERQKAYDFYVAGAPYAVDHRWYSKRFSRVIGYTYNWIAGMPELGSETHIWTNWRMIGEEKEMAAHTAHELSHQGRAHAYLHVSTFSGSYPYDTGDLVAQCIAETFGQKVDMLKAVDFFH